MSERLHLGIDEAGYAPVLGPLVATATSLVAGCAGPDICARLNPAVSPAGPSKAGGPLVVADSKVIYRSGCGLAGLERGVLAFARVAGMDREDDLAFLGALAPEADLSGLPWYAGEPARLPVEADVVDIELAAERLEAAMSASRVRDFRIRSRVVTARDLNSRLCPTLNKADLLGREVCGLLAETSARAERLPASIMVDRLGGRKDYAALLSAGFPSAMFEVEEETPAISRYRSESVEIAFACEAEGLCLTVALSSMVSKYLRELLMRRLNAFFARSAPGLRPTAGYPGDAARFLEETAAARFSMGLADCDLIRSR